MSGHDVQSPHQHPLLDLLIAATAGHFPAVDGGITVMPPLDRGGECVMAFTGHAVIATALPADELREHGADGFGGASAPDLLRWIAGAKGIVGVTDVTLFALGTGGSTLPVRTDLDDHPRVSFARLVRSEVTVYGDDRGLVTLGTGIAGRRELSIAANQPGQGNGRSLVADALGLVPRGHPLFAAVSPGNARSLRVFLACGFIPIGSEVLIRPAR